MEAAVQLIHCPAASHDHTSDKYKNSYTQRDQAYNTVTGNSKMPEYKRNNTQYNDQKLHRYITLPVSAVHDHQYNDSHIDQYKC